MKKMSNIFLRRSLLALSLALSNGAAWAELPRDVEIDRISPTRIAVVWSGQLAAKENYTMTVDGAPAPAQTIAGAQGRIELEHAAGIRPYVRIDDGQGHHAVVGERVLPLQGGINFRDLGGYRTPDGRSVRWGTLYRSGVMSSLTDADYDYLKHLGIKTICDLRSDKERSVDPTQVNRIAPGVKYLSWDYDMAFDVGAFAKAFSAGGDPQETALRLMAGFYRTMPAEFAPRYREAFDALKAGDGLLFNCSAGKDRTGLLAALVLTSLGVAPDAVVSDYAMSQRVPSLKKLAHRKTGKDGKEDPGMAMLAKLPPPAIAALMGTDPVYLNAAFDQIRADHGSIDAYLERELGVTTADREVLKKMYLEPAPTVATR